jgi:hypothetical protein
MALIVEQEALTTEQTAAFAWFDGLDFPNLAGLPVVHVATGCWTQTGDDPPVNAYIYGFLLEDAGKTFTVFTLSLLRLELRKTRALFRRHERVGYKRANLAAAARARMGEMKRIKDEDDPFARLESVFERETSAQTEAFVWGRACAANGLPGLARELFDFGDDYPAWGRKSKHQSLRDYVEEDIAHVVMWRNVRAFGDPRIDRGELLARFEAFVHEFPRSRHLQRAKSTASILRRMVAEDEEHASRPVDLAATSERERVAELIFRLRNQRGCQMSQPGRCDIFAEAYLAMRRKPADTPAHQLVKIGNAAVPQLIEALDDERFTRSVGFHRDFYFSHHVLRVGDAARAIIERIAGREFCARKTTSSEMAKGGHTASVKESIQAWWREISNKRKASD